MKITITNTFHGTSCIINIQSLPHKVTKSQERKIEALCGVPDCKCSQHTAETETGRRLAIEIGAGDEGRWLLS